MTTIMKNHDALSEAIGDNKFSIYRTVNGKGNFSVWDVKVGTEDRSIISGAVMKRLFEFCFNYGYHVYEVKADKKKEIVVRIIDETNS